MIDGAATSAAAAGRCFLCGGSAARVVWQERRHVAVACGCGLTFVQPPPSGVDPALDSHPASFYRLPAAAKIAWLRRFCDGGRLYEIGCGEGAFLEAARRAGFAASGIDVHAGRVERARRLGLDVAHGLFEDAELAGGFDAVCHCDLLSHFPEPIAALEKMRALLAPGGVLFFEVGVLGGAARRWYRRMGGVGLPDHRWLYDDRALERLLRRAGLRAIARRRYGLGPAVLLVQAVWAAASLARGGAPAAEPVRGAERDPTLVDRVYERMAHIARYRLGALTPNYGPATLLVVARPA